MPEQQNKSDVMIITKISEGKKNYIMTIKPASWTGGH
jgi:hypothetical protein